ncbi:MAG: hypothetical protein Phyf2KO_03700 [Phycisphaerales bacterium]
MTGAKLAIEIRSNRVMAAWSGRRPGWIDESIPDELDQSARSDWLREKLVEAGAPTGKVLLVVPRREVVLLQLELGAPDGASESDLHSIARLSLGSHSTLDPHSCILDVVRSDDGRHAVCAAPAAIVDETKRHLKAAGRSIGGVTNRSSGLAAVVPTDTAGLVLVVGKREVEIAVINEGVPVLARHQNRNGDSQTDISKIVSEVHRAVTSVTMVGGIREIRAGYVHAEPGIRKELMSQLHQDLGDVLHEIPAVIGSAPQEVLPLMLLAESDSPPVMQLRSVRPPAGLQLPQIRIAAGLVVFVLIIVVGGWLVLAQQRDSVRNKIGKLRTELGQLQSREREHLREEARLTNIEAFVQQKPVWSDHLVAIQELVPEKGIVVDRLVGSGDYSVSFVAKRDAQGRRYAGGKWSESTSLVVDMNASVDDRNEITRFRQILIDDPRFEVESQGPELPDRFTFRLTSILQKDDESKSEGGLR